MGLKIEYDNPSYPKGQELGIQNVGVIKNGGSLVISDAVAKQLVDQLNENLGEDDKKKTQSDLFKGDMFKTSKVADPDEPSEEATEPPVLTDSTGTTEGVTL